MAIEQTPPEQLDPQLAANRRAMQGFFDQHASSAGNNAEGSEAAAAPYPYEADQADTQELPVVVDRARPYSNFQREVVTTWTQGDSSLGWEEASTHTSERVARTTTRASLGSAALTFAGVVGIVAGMSSGNEKVAIVGGVTALTNVTAGAVQRRVRSWARSNSNS